MSKLALLIYKICPNIENNQGLSFALKPFFFKPIILGRKGDASLLNRELGIFGKREREKGKEVY